MTTEIEEKIDLDFVIELEGYRSKPYVLDPDKFPTSGITLGWGVDLGQWDGRTFLTVLKTYFNEEDVKKYFSKVRPFLGLKGKNAKAKLPLAEKTLTAEDVYMLSLATTAYFLRYLENYAPEFATLSRKERTAIFATAWHRGLTVLLRRNTVGAFVRAVLARNIQQAKRFLAQLIKTDTKFARRHRKTLEYLA